MNFVWTRERSTEKQHDRGGERSNGGFRFQRKTSFYVFPFFSVLRQLTRSHKTTRRILQEAGLLSTR
nr:unnamed protein product [Callosobruchus analis]